MPEEKSLTEPSTDDTKMPSTTDVPESNVPESNVPESNVPESNVPESNVPSNPVSNSALENLQYTNTAQDVSESRKGTKMIKYSAIYCTRGIIQPTNHYLIYNLHEALLLKILSHIVLFWIRNNNIYLKSIIQISSNDYK